MTRLLIAAAALPLAMCLDVPAGYAFGNAPWCAVMEVGTGEMYWDCEYATVEQCVPNVVAGNRGFCNLNPWPGPYASAAVQPTHRKRHFHR
jgi:hypothetical protein